jgi:hypothetical protein
MNRLWALVAIVLSPIFAIYGLWVYCGSLADKLGQKERGNGLGKSVDY